MPLPKAKPAVKTVTLSFDDEGYPGWQAVLRLNPPAGDWDAFLKPDIKEWWGGFKAIVLDWNFVDDAGQLIPLPRDGGTWEVLPFKLLDAVVNKYLAAFRQKTELPKENETPSATTSSTDASPTTTPPSAT